MSEREFQIAQDNEDEALTAWLNSDNDPTLYARYQNARKLARVAYLEYSGCFVGMDLAF